MAKGKAHAYEKLLRSLHYNATGSWKLGIMVKPYPRNLLTGKIILPK
jgi:hypothetical protein